jgi:hypothetical protein
MQTTISKDELQEMGRKVRANYLAEQAGYTFGLAAAEGEDLSDLMPEGFLTEAGVLLDKVNVSRKDRTLMAEEAKEATSAQADVSKSAKVWRRKAVGSATRATRFGHHMPDGLLRVGRVTTKAALAGQIKDMIELFEENLSLMPGKNAKKLLDEGKSISAALSAADTEQNMKGIRDLPTAVLDFYELKARLYLAVKVINDAGHELYAYDANKSGLFNLQILHRPAGRKKSDPAPVEGPSSGK